MSQQSPQPGQSDWPPPLCPPLPQPGSAYPGDYQPQSRKSRFVPGVLIGLVIGIVAAVSLGMVAIVGAIIFINQTSASSLGDDSAADALYAACADGDMGACDDLYLESAVGSDLEDFGATCGGRLVDWTTGDCADLSL